MYIQFKSWMELVIYLFRRLVPNWFDASRKNAEEE